MAGTFTATGTYSNLNRLELESLRLADDFAAAKALTVGDSALPPEGVVGPGLSPNAEPFLTGPNVKLDDTYAITPPTQPGPGIGTLTQPETFVSETVKWYGPTYVTDGTAGYASATNQWSDVSGVNFTLAGILVGDVLLIKPSSGSEANPNFVATVVTVAPTTLTVDHIYGPGAVTSFTVDSPTTDTTTYLVVRPAAVQLFAVPSSGSTGHEQTFLAVTPGATIHNDVAPTTDQINAVRILNLVPSQYALNSSVDRSDAVFDAPAPRLSLDLLGYRVVLYTDNGLGTGPNLANPIATLNPTIDPSIVSTDQRFTIDYKAGAIRFSCAPQLGGQIKVAGGTNPTTGRLNLYATFWAVDTSLTIGAARSLYGVRSTNTTTSTPGKVYYDTTYDVWRIGATNDTNALFVRAPDPTDDVHTPLYFGFTDNTSTYIQYRYFSKRAGTPWVFTNNDVSLGYDSVAFGNPVPYNEMRVGQALEYTVADLASPPTSGADYSPTVTLNPSSFGRGSRDTTEPLNSALSAAATGDTGVVRLKRGKYQLTTVPIYVPPGVVIEGDGDYTVIQVRSNTSPGSTTITPGFKFGPNTPWGLYDLTWNGSKVEATVFDYSGSNVAQQLEGADTVWNPVRKCWGVAWADVNHAIWFNEVNKDGTTTFPGFGVNVKTTANPLFTALSTNSSFHTPGHYPRIVHQANADQYAIAWVDQVTMSGVVGPQVYLNVVQVNPAITAAQPGEPSGSQPLAELVFITSSAYAPFTTVGQFTDHPSIAADNSSTSPFWPLFFGCWLYTYSGTGPTVGNSTNQLAVIQTSSIPSNTHNGGTNFGSNYIISSTDVDEDEAGNAFFVWSRRAHSLLMGTHGEFTTGFAFVDATFSGATPFDGAGVIAGSRFCYLGNSNAFQYPYDTTIGLPHTSPVRESGVLLPYGTDGVVTGTGSTTLSLKSNIIGVDYNYGSPYRKISSTTTGSLGSTLIDSSQNFTTNGVVVGDCVLLTTTGQIWQVTAIAPGGNIHEITLNSSAPGSGPGYKIFYASPFNWAIAPSSIIEGTQYTLSNQFIGTNIEIAGSLSNSASSYILEPTEPDFVRIKRGGDNWLVVYQAMETTSYFAHDSMTNWNDGQTTWNSMTFEDNTLYYRQTAFPYRKHISTCSVVLSANGLLLGTNYNDTATISDSFLDFKVSRDIEISNRSLGAIYDPLTYRPNYAYGFAPSEPSGFPLYRNAKNLALEISPICFFHKWTTTAGTSLIPDITWTGDDWVVVSPTKKNIHSYTGNYIVNGSGQVFFGDPAFMFGANGPNTQDQNYQRQTVEINDLIYFPSIAKYASIENIHSDHTVMLSELDSALFGYGDNTQEYGIEWYLVRIAVGGGTRPGGIKNLGYRVSVNGGLILSSSYNSFADELPDNSVLNGGASDRLPLMSRANTDLAMWWSNLNADGHNLPGNISDDIMDPEARYMGDPGFRGVAPGEPHGCNDQSSEPAFVAIAWGENYYGFVDHIVEGSTSNSTATNQVRFYRQSFGPYHSGLRNLKIIGNNQPPLNASASTKGSELKVLTQQLVFTRHGAPVQGHGYFATDGFRNFFAHAGFRGLYGFNATFGNPLNAPWAGAAKSCLQGFYTDAVGRYSIQVQGPEVLNTPYPGTTNPLPNSYRCDLYTNPTEYSYNYSPSAPRVIWDGQRFVTVWIEGGFRPRLETSPLLCIAVWPGGEDAGPQGPELVNPQDLLTKRPSQVSMVETRNLFPQFLETSTSAIGIYDVAFSGKVYAVLWTMGLDPVGVGNDGQQSSMVGVTLFEANGIGGTLLDYDPMPTINGASGSWNGTVWEDTTTGSMASGTDAILPGDILVVLGGPNAGRYLITSHVNGTPNFNVSVYPPMVSDSGTSAYTIHHPVGAGGAISFVLGTAGAGAQNGTLRDAFNGPCITWDGKQFVAVWRGKLLPITQFISIAEQQMQCLMFPETGLAHAHQTRYNGTTGTYTYQAIGGPESLLGLGMAQAGNLNPAVIFMAGPVSAFTSTCDITGNNTVTDSTGPYYEQGIAPGDLVVITSGASQYGMATIVQVNSATQLIVSGDINPGLAGFPSPGAFINGMGQSYLIYRRHTYKVQLGDTVRVQGVQIGSTMETDNNGDQLVWSVDYYNNCILIGGNGLHSTIGETEPVVYGSIVHGQFQDITQLTYQAYGDFLAPYGAGSTAVGNDISAVPRVIGHELLTNSNSIIGVSPDFIYKLVYNEVTDDYAVLYSSSGNLGIGIFDRRDFQLKKETLLYSSSPNNYVKCADMAWNGSRYFVVYSDSQIPVVSSEPAPLRYAVLTAGLQIEDLGPSNSTQGFLGVATCYNLAANGVGDVPGPTYANPNIDGTAMSPVWRQCRVLWNPRLNRWVVSGSMVWTSDLLFETTKYDFYSGLGATPTQEFACEYHLPNATVNSVTGNNIYITDTTFPEGSFLIQGMKLAWLDTAGGTGAWGGSSSILNVVNTGANTWTITVGTSTFPTNFVGSVGALFVLPREDVFCWTLGYDTPTIAFEDADATFLENVTISGGTSDIEERYKRMARPVWQSGGVAQGLNSGTADTSLSSGVQRPNQYNHKLMTPTFKVELPRFMGVKSYAKYKAGGGYTPGNPIFDRYTLAAGRFPGRG